MNVLDCIRLESGSVDIFDKKRCEVFGGPTDSGVERGIEGVSVNILESHASHEVMDVCPVRLSYV